LDFALLTSLALEWDLELVREDELEGAEVDGSGAQRFRGRELVPVEDFE
jgi:hypothetical protein